MSLTEKAMLARLSITQWSARKMDKRVTEDSALLDGTRSHPGKENSL